jgi:hypothetical protein
VNHQKSEFPRGRKQLQHSELFVLSKHRVVRTSAIDIVPNVNPVGQRGESVRSGANASKKSATTQAAHASYEARGLLALFYIHYFCGRTCGP